MLGRSRRRPMPRTKGRGPQRGKRVPPREAAEGSLGEAAVEQVLEHIRRARSFDFGNYKRATLRRRIQRRMQDRGTPGVQQYLALLDREPGEYDALLESMLIKVTSFF